jgi:hypothetical protein
MYIATVHVTVLYIATGLIKFFIQQLHRPLGLSGDSAHVSTILPEE